MKKTIAFILAMLMLTALAVACEQRTPGDTTTPTDTTGQDTVDTTTAETTLEEITSDIATDEETTQPPEDPEPALVTLYQLAPEKNSLMQSYVIKTKNNR